MTRTEIVEELGRRKAVEEMVSRITRGTGYSGLDQNGKDLVQMVYEILLTYDEEKIVDLWDCGQLQFFIARIIRTQAFSSKSPFWYAIRRFSARTEDISGKEVEG